jgi:hypothetical protein
LKDTISKPARAKWIRGVTQAIEPLLCQYKVLNSNLSLNSKKQQQKNPSTTKIPKNSNLSLNSKKQQQKNPSTTKIPKNTQITEGI